MSKFLSQQFIFAIFLIFCSFAKAQTNTLSLLPQYVQHKAAANAFKIADAGQTAQIYVDANDWKGVIRAANDLGDDVRKITGKSSSVIMGSKPVTGAIIIGTIGKSKLIDGLIAAEKIDVSTIKGQWESFVVQTVGDNLIIAGSDKRGTIYGIYDVSEKMGVSPWYWWADASPQKSNTLYVSAGRYVQPSPKVKYRGIFINVSS